MKGGYVALTVIYKVPQVFTIILFYYMWKMNRQNNFTSTLNSMAFINMQMKRVKQLKVAAFIIIFSNLLQLILASPKILMPSKDFRSIGVIYVIVNINFGLLPQLMAMGFFSRHLCPNGGRMRYLDSYNSSNVGTVDFIFEGNEEERIGGSIHTPRHTSFLSSLFSSRKSRQT